MTQTNGNVPISSLLDSNQDNTFPDTIPLSQLNVKSSKPNKNTSLSSLVSRYQTTFNFSSTPTPEPEDDDIIILDNPPTLPTKKSKSQPSTKSSKSPSSGSGKSTPQASRQQASLPTLMPKPASEQASQPKNFNYSDQIKKFQTNIQFGPASTTGTASLSKTSINSIINLDDEESDSTKPSTPTPTSGPPPPKKRRTAPTKKTASPKAEPVTSRPKKKSPSETSSALANVTAAAPVKKPLHAGMITERSSTTAPVKLGAPSFVDLLNSDHESDKVEQVNGKSEDDKIAKPEDKVKEKEKEKEKPEPPIIALNIPLLDPKDPKPGKAEVVINVLRLAEEKYGWSVVHPKAKSAIDIMDDMLDEDDEGDEDDEDDVIVDEEKSTASQATPAPTATTTTSKDKELTEQQLVRQHEIRMIRKVGKYDYEDPFIDDVELQMEEDITTTKEGFFVYWGPLVDDRNISNKKGASKKR
ncbi:Histone promoter control protein 2 [Spathaspora sp. JA1]|nr:Histone promoter control protein 2 [Spathaspora sp. JA1]